MVDLKVEILLPKYYNPNNSKTKRIPVEGKKFRQTYDEIYDQFNGCTIDSSPLIGRWKDLKTGKMIQDENTAYWVFCKGTKNNLRFFNKLKRKLKERFEQDEMMMYYVTIHRI